MISLGDKEIDALYYVDEKGVQHEVEEVWLGEEKVWPEEEEDNEASIHIVGRFVPNTWTNYRYMYINGKQIHLDEEFDYSSDEVLEYTQSATDGGCLFFKQTSSPYEIYIQELERVKGIESMTSVRYLFNSCTHLVKISDIGRWKVKNIVNMYGLFYGCSALTSLDLSKWDVSNVKDMTYMFSGCSALTSLNISEWNVGNVENMLGMFNSCSSLTTLDIAKWDVKNVKNMRLMFSNYKAPLPDISKWDVGNVENMENMFSRCTFESLNVSDWDVHSVTNFAYTFSYCSNLSELDISNWNVGNATTMVDMFTTCSALKELNLSKWNVENVEKFTSMFYYCGNLISLDLSQWRNEKATLFNTMFSGCIKLETLKLGYLDMGNATNLTNMFERCTSLTNVEGVLTNIPISLRLNQSSLLTPESAMVFINGLKDGVTGQNLLLTSTTYSQLTLDQLAVATAKGWSVTSV